MQTFLGNSATKDILWFFQIILKTSIYFQNYVYMKGITFINEL